jgi:cysteine-rich repeat protein
VLCTDADADRGGRRSRAKPLTQKFQTYFNDRDPVDYGNYLGRKKKGAFMKKFMWFAVGCVALLWSSAGVAQTCPGDCDGSGDVAINELITCVNIALGSSPVSACPSCDVDGDGEVAINELISSVNAALDPASCGGGDGLCGNNTEDDGEECDDGNIFGGDGCAANCTTEDERVGTFNPEETIAVVQTEAIPITLNLTGQQTFRTGHMRDTVTNQVGGGTIPAGQIPAVIRADELLFDPVRVTGLVCACVRGIPVEAFGPGISASGGVACADGALSDINYRMVQDHNTTPGSPNNFNMGTPNDAECDDTSPLPAGGTATACLEGTGAKCSMDSNQHIGVCQGPRVITFSGGAAPMGSAFLVNSTAIGLLSDAGACATNKPMRNGKCLYEDYGPDCLPCTDDDLEKGNTEVNPTTSGTAEAALFDANNGNAVISKDTSCFGSPCITTATGAPFDCSQLGPGTGGGLSGGALGVCFTSLDAAQIGDNVTCTTFSNQ